MTWIKDVSSVFFLEFLMAIYLFTLGFCMLKHALNGLKTCALNPFVRFVWLSQFFFRRIRSALWTPDFVNRTMCQIQYNLKKQVYILQWALFLYTLVTHANEYTLYKNAKRFKWHEQRYILACRAAYQTRQPDTTHTQHTT